MARISPVTTPDTRLADVIRELQHANGRIEIEEEGKTVAVVLSPAEYEAIVGERAWSEIDAWRARNRDKSPDEIYREVTKIVEEVRQEMYDEQIAGSDGC